MKLLNLDELAPTAKRTVRLNGENHEVVEMSVGKFIDSMKKANELQKLAESGAEIPVHETFNAMIDTVAVALPTCQREVLAGLTFDKLALLMKFINGDDAPIVAGQTPLNDEVVPATEQGGGEKKS